VTARLSWLPTILKTGVRKADRYEPDCDPVRTHLHVAMRCFGELSKESELLRARVERLGPWGGSQIEALSAAPAVSGEGLHAMIKDDLEGSPVSGEGYSNAWACAKGSLVPRTEPCAWTTDHGEYVWGHCGNQVRFWGVAATDSWTALGLFRRSPSVGVHRRGVRRQQE
jgi:hypothetical protein